MLEQVPTNKNKNLIKIKVLGIGGGGNNAVIQMTKTALRGVEYVIINTEKGILERTNTKDLKTLQIGKNSALYLVQNGIIPARKVMGKWRIMKEDVIEYITHI